MTLATGARLNHYEILSPLGAGGMGEVYLAEDTKLSRKVALKLLPAEFTRDAVRVRRFEQEAKAVSSLNHPHIITIHEIGEAEVGRFIVMELVQGQTLRALDKPCAPDLLVNIGGQIAKALIATHAAGVTHRDIKPDNIMLRDDGYVKILDFGLAQLMPATANDSEAATLMRQTTPGALLGTVAYMSPEQARGETAGAASDIFALGVVFYELATGQRPFIANSLVGMLHAINSQTPAAPARLTPDLPVALEELILRMLEKEGCLRPTAAEMDQTLEGLSGRSGSGQLQRPAAKPAIKHHTVGREKERAELRGGFESALNGRGQLFCVAGEPGIGKTTLVEDFLTGLAAAGQCTIARGRCSEYLAGTGAYLPLLEALESLLQSSSSPAMARVMKQIAPTWYAQVAPLSGSDEKAARLLAELKAASQERMKRELGAFLQEVARLRPLVMFFDDLHWADVSTIDLLRFVSGKFDALNVLIVVTYRPSDMMLVKHPFLQIKPDLQAHGACRELQLEFLNEAEVAQYLALEFPHHRFPTEFPKLIHAKTEGSPLFMADLVRYLRDRNVIAQTSGLWTLAQTLPDIERDLPESVRGMIERKIAQLSDEDRKLLTVASVQGYEFDSAVVAQVLKLEAEEVEERLEKLEQVLAFVRLVNEREFPNGMLTLRYRFVHVLYQNALYASLRPTRKAALSCDVAQTMESFFGAQRVSVANELSALYEAGREHARAAEYFRLAAEQANQVFATPEAAQLARRGLTAVQALPESSARDEQELAILIVLGNALIATQGYAAPEVERTYLRAFEMCQQTDSPHLISVLFGLYAAQLVSGNNRKAQVYADEMLRLCEQQQHEALIVARRAAGVAPLFMGELAKTRALLERAREIYDSARHRPLAYIYGHEPEMANCAILSQTLWLLGYPDQSHALSREGVRLGMAISHANSQGYALLWNSINDQFRGDWKIVSERTEKAIALSAEQQLPIWSGWASVLRGWALTEQGQVREGIEQIRDGLAILRATGAQTFHAYFLWLLAGAYGKACRPREGLATLSEAEEPVEKNDERWWEAEIHRLRGELLLMDGQPEAAVETCFHQAVEIARRQQAKSLELRAVMSLARLWQRQSKLAEARQVLAEIYDWFTEGFDTPDLKDARTLLDELLPRSFLESPPTRD